MPYRRIIMENFGAKEFGGASSNTHRIAIGKALKCRERGEQKLIAFDLSGHGHFDMMAYGQYHQGKLEDYEYPDALVQEAMTHLPKVPAMR